MNKRLSYSQNALKCVRGVQAYHRNSSLDKFARSLCCKWKCKTRQLMHEFLRCIIRYELIIASHEGLPRHPFQCKNILYPIDHKIILHCLLSGCCRSILEFSTCDRECVNMFNSKQMKGILCIVTLLKTAKV